MKIGDEVYIHGYVDEIRKDIAIIRNEGGYFGAVMDEIVQEPKIDGDCISRQAVLEQINCWIGSGEYRYTNATDYLTRRIKELPSVNPQEPKIKALGEELRSVRNGIKGDKTLIGYNMAIAICNKYLSDSGEQEPKTDISKRICDFVAVKEEDGNVRKVPVLNQKIFNQGINDVLDKIRAEIADLDDADYDYEGYYKAVTDALQIIDKYRKE